MAVLALSDGTVLWGYGVGACGYALGEVVFATGMSGYQETLTDPSYAEQIITFAFPHIGVTELIHDHESRCPCRARVHSAGTVDIAFALAIVEALGSWLRDKNMIAITGVDTRAIVRKIRQHGPLMGGIAYTPHQPVNPSDLLDEVREVPCSDGRDVVSLLVGQYSTRTRSLWRRMRLMVLHPESGWC